MKLGPGEHVEFTLPRSANAITVRYSIPDAPGGGGITAPLDVAVNGAKRSTMTLTSQYSWLYNQYPFTNDPDAGLQPGWWITECACVPAETTPAPVIAKPFRPNHFYDEERLLLGRTYRAGDTVRLTAPAGSRAAWTVIDVLDSELVPLPKTTAGLLRALSSRGPGPRPESLVLGHLDALTAVGVAVRGLPPGRGSQAPAAGSHDRISLTNCWMNSVVCFGESALSRCKS
ncbi:hypothetical protein SMICM304S_06085 [Streptomyces microflavus]